MLSLDENFLRQAVQITTVMKDLIRSPVMSAI